MKKKNVETKIPQTETERKAFRTKTALVIENSKKATEEARKLIASVKAKASKQKK